MNSKLEPVFTNVNILEELGSMSPSAVSFGNLNMEGSAKIISLIAEDENQHLVLTQQILNKWKNVMTLT